MVKMFLPQVKVKLLLQMDLQCLIHVLMSAKIQEKKNLVIQWEILHGTLMFHFKIQQSGDGLKVLNNNTGLQKKNVVMEDAQCQEMLTILERLM